MKRTHFFMAAAIVVAQGCGGTGADNDLSGKWAMFHFEDPVVVEIDQSGSLIEGRGCCGERQTEVNTGYCCGLMHGQVVGRQASFGFSFDDLGEGYAYTTDVYVSADGKRMAGSFSRSGRPVAWVPIQRTAAYLSSDPDSPLAVATADRTGSYGLLLSSDPPAGDDFSAQRMYQLHVSRGAVSGDLGAFWDGEMAWRADEHTVVIGPVPETAPELPVALSLRFEGTALATVEATMASGARYRFQAMASQQP